MAWRVAPRKVSLPGPRPFPLSRLGHPATRFWRRIGLILAILGPGLITGAAGDDAGGIATYAAVGAQYGYGMIWALIPVTVALLVVQLQVARLGLVSGKGLSELIREQFGVRWSAFAMLVLLVANGAVTIAEFAGIAAAGELFGIPRFLSVPVAALLVWAIVVRGSYKVTEKIFLVLSAALLTYVGSAFLAHPDWAEVGRQAITPSFVAETGYLTTLVTLIGTTITPYMLFYLQSSLSDRGASMAEYGRRTADVALGSVLSILIALCIILSTAATLFVNGIAIESAEDAARALEPLAGPYARILFGLGLFGASMLAASVLPLTTAYAVCGAFGWERGVSRSWSEAPLFNGIYSALIALGALFVLVPGLPLIQVIISTQTLNGLLLPIVLLFLVRLANDPAVMGRHVNGRAFNVLAYGITGVLIVLTAALLVLSVLGAG